MGLIAAIGFLLIAGVLLWAAKQGRISSETLQVSANVAAVVSAIAAIAIFLVPLIASPHAGKAVPPRPIHDSPNATLAVGRSMPTEVPTPKPPEVPKVAASPKPRFAYKAPVFVGDGFFRIEIVSARKTDASEWTLDMTVKSLQEGVVNMGLVRPETTAFIVDENGNRHYFLRQQNLNGSFPAGVDIRGSMTFGALRSPIKRISVVFRYKPSWVYETDVILRNLDLGLMKLVEPIDDDGQTK